jgi:hypothetical protein
MKWLVTSLAAINVLVFLGFSYIPGSGLPSQPPSIADQLPKEVRLPGLTLIAELPPGDSFLLIPESAPMPDTVRPDSPSIKEQENLQKPANISLD